ncbi:MAG: apolipoprotein N-acyltransferase, partial [Rhodospirillaceae bacterium]|nr:apolipoprotein N-acyltransferase [Rhodospirillaceae bacterium]
MFDDHPDNIFKRIDLYLIKLPGWRLFAISFFSGALAVFAFAPLHMIFMLLPSFSILTLLSVRQQSWKKAFIIGWWWGAGFFSAGLYWISMALLVDA